MQVLCLKPPIQPMQRGKPSHPQVCQLRRGTRNHQQGVSQKANLGQQIQGSTEENRAATGTGSPNQECLDQKVCSNNGRLPTNFNYSRGPSHTEAYSRSIKATSRTNETRSYQDSSSRSATADTQGTTPSTTEIRKSAMWSRPKKSTVEPTGGRNRSDNHCSGRGNGTVEESFNRVKAPYPGTTKDDRGSSRCDKYPQRIEGCLKKVLFRATFVHIQ